MNRLHGAGDACDGDGDGVDDVFDLCALTPGDVAVDDQGCSGAQRIALSCIRKDFAKHGHYVRCVAHAANEAPEEGLISPQEKGRFVSQAARGDTTTSSGRAVTCAS